MKPSRPRFTEPPLSLRISPINAEPVHVDRRYVVYWMIAARRPSFNFALDRSIAWARALGKPIVILEALRVDYPWASDRLHRFVIDGMRANHAAFADASALHHPYVERTRHAGRGLLERLAQDSAVIVTDDYPCFFLPQMVQAAGRRLDVRLESVDSNGLIPLAATYRAFRAAVHFRRHVQKTLRAHLLDAPSPRPFQGISLPTPARLPADVTRRWPAATNRLLSGDDRALRALPIDHEVPVCATRGGFEQARRALRTFVAKRLERYHVAHNHPDDRGTSRLSPYLHFGHLSAHEVFQTVMKHERWTPGRLPATASGAREGWWRVSPGAEAFLDQLIVWRELAFNTCAKRPHDYDRFESLPPGRWKHWPIIRTMNGSMCIRDRNSSKLPRTTRCGTRRSARCGGTAGFTITCACCGARKSSNGHARRKKHWTR